MASLKVGKTADLPSGIMKTIHVQGKTIALANVDGQYFAVDDTCTHKGCSLGTEGFLDGTTITCGCHGGQFDVTTGKVLAAPPTTDVSSYPVQVVGEDISLEI